jgi:drug/metabolite transporter (DMT)-like permease
MAINRTSHLSYVKITLAPILWGGSLVAGRYIANDVPAITITWIRFSIVAALLLPALRVFEGRLHRPSVRGLMLLAALTTTGILLFNVFLFSGLQTVTATRSSVIIAFAPSAVALILFLMFREPLRTAGSVGIVLAFVGATITITEGDPARAFSGGIGFGDLFLLGCVVSWAAYTIIARYAMREMTALTVLTYSSVLGALLLTPIVLVGGGAAALTALSPRTWGALLYLSVGAAGIAYLFYYQAIRDIGANEAAVFLNLEPVSAIVLGVLLLGESLTLPVLFGGILVIAGLYLVNRRG